MNKRLSVNTEYYVPLLKRHGASCPANGYSEESQRTRLRHMMWEIRDFRGKSVLDVGCGWGDIFNWIALRGIDSYHGIDIVKEMVDRHIHIHIGPPYSFQCIDLFDVPDDRKYDYVIANGTFNLKCGGNDSLLFNAAAKMFGLANELTVMTVSAEPEPMRTDSNRNTYYYPDHVLRKIIGYFTNRYKIDRSYHDWEVAIYLYKPA